MDASSGSRALSAVDDLVELLRLAQSAAERLAEEVYGPAFEHAQLISRDMQRLRRSAQTLKSGIESFVSREENATVERDHPLRRQGDRAPAPK